MVKLLAPQGVLDDEPPAPGAARVADQPAEASGGAPVEPLVLPRVEVVVGIASDDPSIERDALAEVLAGHFADTGLEYRVATFEAASAQRWASAHIGEPEVLAVFWIEGADAERRLYLFEPRRGTTWVRELPPSTDPDELLESLGAMVRGISLWLDEGAPPEMDAAEVAPPPEPEPTPPPEPAPPEPTPSPAPLAPALAPVTPEPRPRAAWGLSLAYAGGNLAREAPWQSGGSVGVELEWPIHVTAEVGASLLRPAVLDSVPATTVWRLPLHVGVGYRFRPGRMVRPLVDLAFVVEPMWWRVQSTAEVTGRSGRTTRAAIAPGVGVRIAVWRGLGVVVHARADLRVLDADLVVFQGGRRVSRLSPDVVAAFVRGGLSYVF